MTFFLDKMIIYGCFYEIGTIYENYEPTDFHQVYKTYIILVKILRPTIKLFSIRALCMFPVYKINILFKTHNS